MYNSKDFIKKELLKNNLYDLQIAWEIGHQLFNFTQNCYYDSYSSYRGVYLDFNEGGYEKKLL